MNLSINLHNYAFGVTSDKSGIIVVYLKKRREAGSKACCRGAYSTLEKSGLNGQKARDCRQKKNANRIFQIENRFTKYLHNQNY